MHDRSGGFGIRRRQNLQRALGPGCRLPGEVEVEVRAIADANAAQGLEPRIDSLTNRTEVGISRIPERQHGKTNAVEAQRGITHKACIKRSGPLRRITLAPGRGEHDHVLGLGQRRHIGVGHVQHASVEPVSLRQLARLQRQSLGIARLAGIEKRERNAHARRGCG